ncbi:MAG: thioredoxin family protein [Gammaproteobacteria bacterium]|nr:thioredoxin family protein [Gammaproteobacteria bacterium]
MSLSKGISQYLTHSTVHSLFKLFIILLITLSVNFISGCSEKEAHINTPEGMTGLTDKTINDTIKHSVGHLLVHFTSYDPKCGYCSNSNPYIEKLMQNYKGNLKVARISWEPWNSYSKQSKSITKQYWIRGLPMFILYNNGQEIWRGTGHTPANTNKIEELLSECCS